MSHAASSVTILSGQSVISRLYTRGVSSEEAREAVRVFDFMRRCKDRLPPDSSNAFWLGHLSDFDRCCSRLTITCAIKVPREQNETSRLGQALQLLKISCESLDNDTLYSHWLDSVMTSTRCVYSNNSFPIMLTNLCFITVKLF